MQLFKNALIMAVARPVRSLFAVAVDVLPVILFFFAPNIFLYLGLVWIFIYYSIAASVTALLFRKPFKNYSEKFYARQPAKSNQ